MNNFAKNITLWIIIGLLLIALFNIFSGSSERNPQTNISFSEFIAEVEAGNVNSVNIKGNNVEGYLTNGRTFSSYAPDYPQLVEKLNTAGVKISAEPISTGMHPLLNKTDVYYCDVSDLPCLEIDFLEDLNEARSLF